MRRTLLALLLAASALLVFAGERTAAAAPSTPVTPLPAASAGPTAAPGLEAGCRSGSGDVTVVVDFGHFGGGVAVRCAPWPVRSGKDALQKAGFAPEDSRNPRFAGGFLCRIDALPTDGRCHGGAEGYWAYWQATSCQWSYSQVGYSTSEPAPGSVQGYAFGNGARPRHELCPAPPTTAPPTTPTTIRPAPSPPPSSGVPGGGSPTPGGGTTAPGSGGGAAPGAPPLDGSSDVVGDSRGDDADDGTAAADPGESGDDGTTTSDGDRSGNRADGDRDPLEHPADDGEELALDRSADVDREGDSGSGSPLPAVVAVAGVVGLLGVGVASRRARA